MRTWMCVLGLTLPLVGCIPLGCTEMGCSGSYAVSFDNDAWDGELYTFSVALDDGESTTCAFSLPLQADVAPCGLFDLDFDGTTLTVTSLTPMNSSLQEVSIQLLEDGVALFDDTVEPAWSEPFYPNGRVCDAGMGCLSGEDHFTL